MVLHHEVYWFRMYPWPRWLPLSPHSRVMKVHFKHHSSIVMYIYGGGYLAIAAAGSVALRYVSWSAGRWPAPPSRWRPGCYDSWPPGVGWAARGRSIPPGSDTSSCWPHGVTPPASDGPAASAGSTGVTETESMLGKGGLTLTNDTAHFRSTNTLREREYLVGCTKMHSTEMCRLLGLCLCYCYFPQLLLFSNIKRVWNCVLWTLHSTNEHYWRNLVNVENQEHCEPKKATAKALCDKCWFMNKLDWSIEEELSLTLSTSGRFSRRLTVCSVSAGSFSHPPAPIRRGLWAIESNTVSYKCLVIRG